MNAAQSGVQPVGATDPNAKTITWKLVLTRTYQVYAEKFWTYFRIAIVPAIIAYVFSYLAPMVTRQLLRGGIFPFLSGKWVALSVFLGWSTGAVYWTISAFFFAAIAASFEAENLEHTPAVADAYTLPRRRIGAVAGVALLTWTLFFVGRAVTGFAVWELIKHIAPRNYWATTCGFGLVLLVLAGLLSKFGLAIPELIRNTTMSGGSAMKRSLKHTGGWEGFFMIFLLKSATIGYAVYWIAGQGLDWLWQHWTLNPHAYTWIQWSVYIFIAAIVESPLFIAFSVLYEELRSQAENSALCCR